MKKVFLIISVSLFYSCGESDSEKTSRTQKEAAIEAKVKAEMKEVFDVSAEHGILTVAVKNDGYQKNTYAEYICDLSSDWGYKARMVKVVDVASIGGNVSSWKELGQCFCK